MGTKDGNIIATIITTYMPRNDAAAPRHVCPGIRIHAIDIVQPPGIGISPIADMDAHQTIVTAALAAKSSAETPKKACWEARSEAMRRELPSPAVARRQPRLRSALVVLVVAAPPDARLVAPLGCAVEPLVHAPEAVQSARIGGIGVVDDAILEHERAHARPLARIRGHVGSGHGRVLGDRLRDRRHVHHVVAAPVVVFDGPLALLLLGERDVEVEVEVAAERGRPGKRPPHPPLVRLQLGERRPLSPFAPLVGRGGVASHSLRVPVMCFVIALLSFLRVSFIVRSFRPTFGRRPAPHAAEADTIAAVIAAICRSEAFGEDPNCRPKSTANGSGKMSSCPASMPSRIANATSRGEVFGSASSRTMSVSTGPA